MRISPLAYPVALSLLLLGCQEEEQPIASGSMFEGRSQEAARPDQPPSAEAPPPPSAGVQGLSWSVPDDWETRSPSNAMRKAEYGVPGEAGEAELVVFYFGPGQGGGPMDNAVRWARQFEVAGGADPAEVMKTTQMETKGRSVLLVELAGTYKSGGPMMGSAQTVHPGYALLGAVVEGPDAPWFFKLTGPAETVAEARGAFLSMLESVEAAGRGTAG